MQQSPQRYSDEIYDDIWLPDETLAVRQQVRDFAEQHVRPVEYAVALASAATRLLLCDEAPDPPPWWRALAEAGVPSVAGLDQGLASLAA